MVHMGNEVDPNAFGSWLDDTNYISGSQYGTILVLGDARVNMNDSFLNSNDYTYSAPENLYWSARTMSSSNGDSNMRYNLTWSFSVDSGFKYLVRLHFCEISMLVTDINQRVFSVYINNQTAEEKLDLVALVGEPLSPLYRDYVVKVPIETEIRKVFMLISLHPNLESKPKYADAILNGVEIRKIGLECLMDFVEIGIQCLANKSVERPTMGDVLSSLEKILSLQKSLEEPEINVVKMAM
ncbi:hypothetical protein TSUD_217580 [Trifolium subterraneum]|uniref:Malectin-like domain-containing protein n=1 Tax=Trifolium subterraneum TaxID=3900 RepID=A0A2Z6MPU7_TRISU|nr:hypothetical protein TSUD_217580 [Trifolium subterraneum]